MPLLGEAAVAMWWNIAPERRAEFGDWHSHEHFPERMSIPGFRRGSRWSSTTVDGDFFVLYELATYDTLTSKAYLDRLNAPTPWSTKMMPHHLNMTRSQCRVAASYGGGIATALATIRLSPHAGAKDELRAAVAGRLEGLASKPGLTGAHLLLTDTPNTTSPTTEQRIRGSDSVADWIIILSGYEPGDVESAVADAFSSQILHREGASDTTTSGQYRLSYTMASTDLGRP